MGDDEAFVHKSRFMNAAKRGEDEVIAEYLDDVSLGCSVATVDSLQETPLHWAARDLSTVQLLLARGAHVNALDTALETPLHKAAWKNHSDVVQELVSHGADLAATNRDGKTPRDLATDYSTRKELLPKQVAEDGDDDSYQREDEDSD